MKFCGHLLVFHDGSLCCRIKLVLRPCLEHLTGLLDVALHVLPQLIDVDGFLAVEGAHVTGMSLCLLRQLVLQIGQVPLQGLLVVLEFADLIELILKQLVRDLQSCNLIRQLGALFLELVLEVLLLIFQEQLESLNLLLGLLDGAIVLLEAGVESPENVGLRLALRSILGLKNRVTDLQLFVFRLQPPNPLLELSQSKVLPDLLHPWILLHGVRLPGISSDYGSLCGVDAAGRAGFPRVTL
mmetsp:Transcript_53314/g.86211  ORF Transcript_53314/g.86211 Transcript_53314/m.86211 type:complete len:241 (-) Transcript_53314:4-726(-)